jgi:hypothetical protein
VEHSPQIRIGKPCKECGTPLVWTAIWQGWDCVVCYRREAETQSATPAGASPRVDVDIDYVNLLNAVWMADFASEVIDPLLAENARLRAERDELQTKLTEAFDSEVYVAGRGIKAESQLTALRLALAGIREEMEEWSVAIPKLKHWVDKLAHLEQEQQS